MDWAMPTLPGEGHLLRLLIQLLTSSGNALTDTPRNNVQSEHLMAQSNWHTKLPITTLTSYFSRIASLSNRELIVQDRFLSCFRGARDSTILTCHCLCPYLKRPHVPLLARAPNTSSCSLFCLIFLTLAYPGVPILFRQQGIAVGAGSFIALVTFHSSRFPRLAHALFYLPAGSGGRGKGSHFIREVLCS